MLTCSDILRTYKGIKEFVVPRLFEDSLGLFVVSYSPPPPHLLLSVSTMCRQVPSYNFSYFSLIILRPCELFSHGL